jgi:hypothetical protein
MKFSLRSAWVQLVRWCRHQLGRAFTRRSTAPPGKPPARPAVVAPVVSRFEEEPIPVGGEPARPTALPVRPISSPITADPDPQLPPPGTLLEANLRQLRRAAVLDTFDHLGLAVAPGQVWTCVDQASSLTEGLEEFFERTGCDIARVRANDAAERDRTNELLELLVDVATAFERLSHDAKTRINRKIYSGQFAEVRQAARIVSIFERIRQLGAATPEEGRLAAVTAFLLERAGSLADPLGASLEQAEAAEAAADQLRRIVSDFDAARLRRAALEEQLSRPAPAGAADQAGPMLEHFDDVCGRLRAPPAADIQTASAAVAELGDICGRLEALLAPPRRSRGGRRRRKAAAGVAATATA